jgi:predicted benzoate:H+ symporter BenE
VVGDGTRTMRWCPAAAAAAMLAAILLRGADFFFLPNRNLIALPIAKSGFSPCNREGKTLG